MREESRTRPVATTVWRIALGIVFVGLLVFAVYRQRTTDRPAAPETVVIYAFSAMEDVMEQAVLPAFRQSWEARTGGRVEFITTYAGSGWVTREILRKVPAEVAILSSELDAWRLVDRGVLAGPVWRRLPHAGVVTRSPIVLVVRSGNPLEISTLGDLTREGLAVAHADPATSGLGEWSLLAVFGAAMRQNGDRGAALARAADTWRNVRFTASSARESDRLFGSGSGDVLVTYEKDALLIASGEIVHPRPTLVSEHVVCKIGRHVRPERAELVDALIDFLWSDEAQDAFVRYGFRPADAARPADDPRFPALEAPVTLDELGGPRQARRDILDQLRLEGRGARSESGR